MTARVVTAKVGLPPGFAQVPQTGIGTYSMTVSITLLPPLVATPNPIYGQGSIGLAIGGVLNPYLADMPAHTLKGNATDAAGVPQDLSVSEAAALLGGPFLSLLDGGTVAGPVTMADAVILTDLPTSPTGLISGQLWRNGTVINIV